MSRPGPMLLKQASTAEMLVSSEYGSSETTIMLVPASSIYADRKQLTPRRTWGSIGWRLTCRAMTARGRRMRRILRFKSLKMSTNRMTLNPPPVLPAQAPSTIRHSRIALEKVGHASKFTVEKPVVVMMLDTWNAAWWMLSRIEPSMGRMFHAMAAVAPAIISRYQRSSSSRNTSVKRRRRSR